MVDCLTLCNTSCLTCIWCFLLSLCFPKYFNNWDDADSNKCAFGPIAKPPAKSCRQVGKRGGSCRLRRRPSRPCHDPRCRVSADQIIWDGDSRKPGACETDRRASNSCDAKSDRCKSAV